MNKAKGTRRISLMLVMVMIFTCLAPAEVLAKPKSKSTKLPAWARGKIIAHAGGSIDGTYQTNSLEALNATLNKGAKCVELDFAFTSDNKLVCAHRSTDFAVKGLGIKVPSEKKWLSEKTAGKYTRMNARTALKLLAGKNVYLIVDSQEAYGGAARVYKEIKRILKSMNRLKYMKKVVPQIYHKYQYKQFRKVYKFSSGIFTLYRVIPLTKKKTEMIAKFCKQKHMVVAISSDRLNSKRRKIFKKHKVIVAVHTVNSKNIWDRLRKKGARVVYTDVLY